MQLGWVVVSVPLAYQGLASDPLDLVEKKTGNGIMETIGDVIHTVAPLAPLLLAAGKKTRSKKQQLE